MSIEDDSEIISFTQNTRVAQERRKLSERVLAEDVCKTVTSPPNKSVAQIPKGVPVSRLSSTEDESEIISLPPFTRVAHVPRELSETHYLSGAQV